MKNSVDRLYIMGILLAIATAINTALIMWLAFKVWA